MPVPAPPAITSPGATEPTSNSAVELISTNGDHVTGIAKAVNGRSDKAQIGLGLTIVIVGVQRNRANEIDGVGGLQAEAFQFTQRQ